LASDPNARMAKSTRMYRFRRIEKCAENPELLQSRFFSRCFRVSIRMHSCPIIGVCQLMRGCPRSQSGLGSQFATTILQIQSCDDARFMATTAHISMLEYLSASYRPDREYVDGEIRERNGWKWEHARVQWLLALWFGSHERQWGVIGTTEQRERRTASACPIWWC